MELVWHALDCVEPPAYTWRNEFREIQLGDSVKVLRHFDLVVNNVCAEKLSKKLVLLGAPVASGAIVQGHSLLCQVCVLIFCGNVVRYTQYAREKM